MAYNADYGGGVNNTNGFSDYTPVVVYSAGIGGFPVGNPRLGDGWQGVYVESVYLDHISGGYATISKDGTVTGGGAWYHPGGSFTLEARKDGGGRLTFGRNTAGGPSPVRNTRDGTTWSGVLCGGFNWSTYPAALSSINPVRSGRDVTVTCGGVTSDGGSGITGYTFEYSDDGGATWKGGVFVGGLSRTFTNLPPGKTYKFRAYAHNARGAGQPIVSGNVFVPAGARRWDGDSEEQTSTLVRWDGTQEVPITVAVRWDGTQEVPLG